MWHPRGGRGTLAAPRPAATPLHLEWIAVFQLRSCPNHPQWIHSLAVQEHLEKILLLFISRALWQGVGWAWLSQESLGRESKSPVTPGSVVSWPAGLILPLIVNKPMWALQLQHIGGCGDMGPRGHRQYCSYSWKGFFVSFIPILAPKVLLPWHEEGDSTFGKIIMNYGQGLALFWVHRLTWYENNHWL